MENQSFAVKALSTLSSEQLEALKKIKKIRDKGRESPHFKFDKWEVRIHFLLIAVASGIVGWLCNKYFLGGNLGLVARHAWSLGISFISMGVLIRLWLYLIGASPVTEYEEPGLMERLEAELPPDIRQRLMEERIKGTFEFIDSTLASISNSGTSNSSGFSWGSSGGSSGGSSDFKMPDVSLDADEAAPLVLVIFLIFLAVAIAAFIGVTIWDAPLLLGDIAADATAALAVSGRSRSAAAHWERAWTWSYLRNIGPRFFLICTLLIIGDLALLYFVPHATSWSVIFK